MKKYLILILLLFCYSIPSFGVTLETLNLETDTKRQVFNKLETNDQSLNNGKAETTNVLQLDNTSAYTPTQDYHPSTKVYVDTNSGENNTVTNVGSGEGIAGTKVGVDIPLKSLNAGTNVTISSTATDVTISATGGGAAVQSDWNETNTGADSYIQNKPVNVTTSVDGFMSSTDKTKLDGIEAGANVSTITADSGDNTKAATAVVSESVDPVKVSGVPGVVLLYEATGTEINGTGFVGPDSATSNIIMQLPSNEPLGIKVLSSTGTIDDVTIDGTQYRQIPLSWTDSGVGGSGYVSTPTYSDTPCTLGEYSWDGTYYYGCEATNQWDRFAVTWANWNNPTPAAPNVTSVTIPTSGDSMSIVFDETVTFGAGGNTGFVNSASNVMTYSSGDGSTTLVYSLASLVVSGDVLTLDYTQPGNGVESNTTGNDVISFSGTAITNNSNQTAPVLSSATIPAAGTTLVLVFDESVDIGAGGNAGFVTSPANNLTFTSGSGTNTLTYTFASTVNSGEVLTLDYTQPGNGVESTATGIDTNSFSGTAITNNSTQTPPAPVLSSATIPAAGTTVSLVFSEPVTFGVGGNTGFVNSASNVMTYSTGDGTDTLVYTFASTVNSGEVLTLDYTQPGNGVEAVDDNTDVDSFSGTSITNNSTQGGASSLTAFIRGTENNGDSLSTGTGTISLTGAIAKVPDHDNIASSAFDIDANDKYVEIQTASNINYSTGKLSFYFRPTGAIQSHHVPISDGTDRTYFSFHPVETTDWRFRINGSDALFTNNDWTALSSGTPYLITITWDENTNTRTMQIDSGAIETSNVSFSAGSIGTNFRIGASSLADIFHINGALDTISIFSTASGTN